MKKTIFESSVNIKKSKDTSIFSINQSFHENNSLNSAKFEDGDAEYKDVTPRESDSILVQTGVERDYVLSTNGLKNTQIE